MMSIGQLAKQSDVSIQSIRFYEKSGLIAEPMRKPSGYRVYEADALRTLQFIKKTRELGFSLDDIKGLLNLRIKGKTRCATVKKKAEVHLESIKAKLSDLQSVADVLDNLIERCARQKNPEQDCPILEAFEQAEGDCCA